MRHTKGPWINRHQRIFANDIPVADSFFTEQSVANAQLIAAAPEMLEALVELVDALYEASGCALKPKHEAISAKALTAIRKARGES